MASSKTSPVLPSLPVCEVLGQLRSALETGHAVLSAAPGSGKTTLVPLLLKDDDWLAGRRIVMLEPRRPAARLAAHRMASLLGEDVGQGVGYQVRFERRIGPQTRIEVLTEGLLLRRLQHDPELGGVGLLIFDEFHERSLVADLSLALALDVAQGLRDDLRLLVMSATIDADPLCRMLRAPLVAAAGRQYPVDIVQAPVDAAVADPVPACLGLLRTALAQDVGDVLVFLPGRREIERFLRDAGPLCQGRASLMGLYGELPLAEQDRVLTRRGDYFVDLNKRSEIARKAKADLLVSVHADSFHNSTPRGASVWVLSTNRANREMGSWLEKQEKQGELLGGVGKVLAESDPNPYLAQTFLDLSMDKSRAEGYDVSRQILRSLGRVARLHKKAPEHASLAVLKAPDIPSVLVETGFISNHAEEKLLATSSYQDQLARAIFEGIRNYYRAHPTKGAMLTGKGQASNKQAAVSRPAPASKPVAVSKPAAQPVQQVVTNRMPATEPNRSSDGGAPVSSVGGSSSGAGVIKPYVVAAKEPSVPVTSVQSNDKANMIRHVVTRGQSLSRLAEKYGVSQARLVEINKLKSRDIQIGQVLYIPQK